VPHEDFEKRVLRLKLNSSRVGLPVALLVSRSFLVQVYLHQDKEFVVAEF
jgi:hypothetical protein